jgi:broad specificity phosphatase PhoE
VTRVIILRHGRTEWNRVERFRGRADIALDEVGKKQAEAAANRIKGWPVSAIYSSPLRRALSTADIVGAALHLTVQPALGIIDIDFGEWQGLSAEDVSARNSRLYSQWVENPDKIKFPGGERFAEARKRVSRTVDDLILKHPKETIVLVSHKVICQILILSLLNLDSSHFWQIEQDVCAMNLFEVRGGIPSAFFINDTCHLNGLK